MESGARDLAALSMAKSPSGGDARKAMEAVRDRLRNSRGQFRENAMAPLELLAELYPLMEDQARFIELYHRQVSLAERLSSLEGRDGEDNPALKRRMRDLENEQAQVRRALDDLLNDIVDHAKALPDDARAAELKQTALEILG